MQKNIIQKVKEEQKIFHSFKELQEEWKRQGIVEPYDTRIKNFRLVSSDNLEKFVVVTDKEFVSVSDITTVTKKK